ncbi:Gfo/Idh/MocA family oxidoreductase [Acetobacter sacchari]|uniref:Gfo/Idh/MocA family oxidoreductase n=1 Tax=Acetobacter sacchari TaxID=2661687 RepID=A0ABS3LYE4_9PROT|nr:Gfo/Idh/MocA family oxidoreductase [Acetobacter sacchari]MBO1360934.1 Gfo/Idh/MocA family oxidoreductase [Acetobacter sacchari]
MELQGYQRPLRLGMVGGGQGAFIGAVHRAAARLSGDFDLVAGCFSSNPDRARQSAALIGIAPEWCYVDYRDMARDAVKIGLDAVSVVTPNFLHVPVAQAFAEQGVHVICDKPLAATWDGIDALQATLRRRNVVFVLTHTYSAYPMIRKARRMIVEGALGRIRSVTVEYLQDWLATSIEDAGNKQAEWRTDPSKGGRGGAVGDIGTHAFHLAEYVSGQHCESLLAMTASPVGNRAVNDDARMLLKFANGATGSLWCSQVTLGARNALTLRVCGEKGALSWAQETPNQLVVADTGGCERLMRRGEQPGEGSLPTGHPEGFYEAFAQLYRDAASLIRSEDLTPSSETEAGEISGLDAGVRGMRFIDATLTSAEKGNIWVEM